MYLKLFCPLIALAIAQPMALAQMPGHAGPAAAPSPSSPAYQSAFADYQPYKEPVVGSWRQANDQVRDAGGMHGHDMATMKSQSDDPHAGHDMSKMAPAMPSAAVPAQPGAPATAEKASVDHAAHRVEQAQSEDPHAGHDMSKMTPAKPRTAAAGVPSSKNKTNPAHPAPPAQSADPHAGHDMSKMPVPAPKNAPSGTDKAADHAAHGAPPQSQPNSTKEPE